MLRYLLLSLLLACAPPLGKFQILVPEAAFTGTVVAVYGSDFDISPDGEYASTMALFPAFHGILHCELYGYGNFVEGDSKPGTFEPQVGQHIYIEGAFVLDNSVHREEREQFTERVVHRGVFLGGYPKPEIHPYYRWKLGLNPQPLALRHITVSYYAELYLSNYLWNRWICLGIDGCGVGDPVDRVVVVGQPR